MTSSSRNLNLDILRVLAIGGVLLFHGGDLPGISPAFSRLASYGWSGVDLFFVLSGFLIGRQAFALTFDRPGNTLAIFWAQRWLRTIPLYGFVLFVYVFIKPKLLGFPFRGAGATYLLFAQNYVSNFDFIQSWSLCVEEHFYLAFPLLLLVRRVRDMPPWFWLFPLVFSTAWRASTAFGLRPFFDLSEGHFFGWETHLHLDGISMGIFLARTFPQWSVWNAKKQALCLFVSLLIAGLIGASFTGQVTGKLGMSFYYTLLAAGFGTLLVATYHYEMPLPSFVKSAVHWIAKISYGVYLWFWLLLRLFEKRSPFAGNWWANISAWLIACVLIASATYLLVELPMLTVRGWVLARLARSKPSF